MDDPGGYYVKWDNLDRERQILYDLIYVWNLLKNKKVKLTEAKSRMEVSKGWGQMGEKWEM